MNSEPMPLDDFNLYRAFLWDAWAPNGGQWYPTIIGRGGPDDLNVYKHGSEVQISEYGEPMLWQSPGFVLWFGPPIEFPAPPKAPGRRAL